ncbi:MAG: DUF4919 domain-containing protein [Flavobacteriales bacterium]|jgi:hypothetical protein|nr:DUF4919 domain-containing protein [Flavobacteriales bacterium]
MKVFFLIIIACCIGILSYAKGPNFKKIKKNINDSTSIYYYGKLMERYFNADKTLTLEEKRHLYYGYYLQDGFEYNKYNNPYSLFRDTAISVQGLKEFPFDIGNIEFLILRAKYKNEVELKEKLTTQLNIILDAMLSYGDGKKKNNPIYLNSEEDIYDIITILGYYDYQADDKYTRKYISSARSTLKYEFTNQKEGYKHLYFNEGFSYENDNKALKKAYENDFYSKQ